MEKAVAALEEEKAHNQCMRMGPKAHILNFPIAQHTLMNVVAFGTDEGEWQHEKMTASATKEEVMKVFEDWAPPRALSPVCWRTRLTNGQFSIRMTIQQHRTLAGESVLLETPHTLPPHIMEQVQVSA